MVEEGRVDEDQFEWVLLYHGSSIQKVHSLHETNFDPNNDGVTGRWQGKGSATFSLLYTVSETYSFQCDCAYNLSHKSFEGVKMATNWNETDGKLESYLV